MDIRSIHLRIEELCKQQKWSYYRLAKEAGFQQSTITTIIKEKYMPSLYTINEICLAFGISLSTFFNSNLFEESETAMYIKSYNRLSTQNKEKVLIYIHGLLQQEIPKEGLIIDEI